MKSLIRLLLLFLLIGESNAYGAGKYDNPSQDDSSPLERLEKQVSDLKNPYKKLYKQRAFNEADFPRCRNEKGEIVSWDTVITKDDLPNVNRDPINGSYFSQCKMHKRPFYPCAGRTTILCNVKTSSKEGEFSARIGLIVHVLKDHFGLSIICPHPSCGKSIRHDYRRHILSHDRKDKLIVFPKPVLPRKRILTKEAVKKILENTDPEKNSEQVDLPVVTVEEEVICCHPEDFHHTKTMECPFVDPYQPLCFSKFFSMKALDHHMMQKHGIQ